MKIDKALPNNIISTNKYTLFNFWFLNLFVQFKKKANIYFLVLFFFTYDIINFFN